MQNIHLSNKTVFLQCSLLSFSVKLRQNVGNHAYENIAIKRDCLRSCQAIAILDFEIKSARVLIENFSSG